MVQVLLSLAANIDCPLLQLDAKNNNKVCRLKQSLYRLKQTPRAWSYKFTRVIKCSIVIDNVKRITPSLLNVHFKGELSSLLHMWMILLLVLIR